MLKRVLAAGGRVGLWRGAWITAGCGFAVYACTISPPWRIPESNRLTVWTEYSSVDSSLAGFGISSADAEKLRRWVSALPVEKPVALLKVRSRDPQGYLMRLLIYLAWPRKVVVLEDTPGAWAKIGSQKGFSAVISYASRPVHSGWEVVSLGDALFLTRLDDRGIVP